MGASLSRPSSGHSLSHIAMFSASLNSSKTKEIKREKEERKKKKNEEKKTNKGLPNQTLA